MPSAVVHLRAAYDLADALGVKNLGQFYAGAVSPDAVNVDGFAEQEVRYPAHLRSLDYEQWKQTVRDFCKENRSAWADREDFLKGFLLHIFTDIYWDELAQPEMFEAFEKMGISQEDMRDVKWQELYRFNSFLKGEWLTDKVLPTLKGAEFFAIGTVPKEQLKRYLLHLTGEYMNERAIDEPPKVCSLDMVQKVEQACLDEMGKLFL